MRPHWNARAVRERLDFAPTKRVLLALTHQLEFLEEGHALLERKRELLTRLVYERLTQYREIRNEARAAVKNESVTERQTSRHSVNL